MDIICKPEQAVEVKVTFDEPFIIMRIISNDTDMN